MIRQSYTLNSIVGEGSYGKVWSAQTPLSSLAIKEAPHENGVSCAKEIDAGMRYRHPHILPVYSFFFDSSTLGTGKSTFLVMPLADRDLAEHMRLYIVKPEFCVKWCFQLASAVQCLHESGFAHGDIKPANCLVFSDSVTLGDLGSVCHKEDAISVRPTVYVSPPEVIGIKGPITPFHCDVWCLGVTFVYILTSRFVFGCSELTETLARQRKYIPNLKGHLQKLGVPAAAIPLILRMLGPVETRISIQEVLKDPLFQGLTLPKGDRTVWKPLTLDPQNDNRFLIGLMRKDFYEKFIVNDVSPEMQRVCMTMLYSIKWRLQRDSVMETFLICVSLCYKLYGEEMLAGDLYDRYPNLEQEIITALGGMLRYPVPEVKVNEEKGVKNVTYHYSQYYELNSKLS